ncbi:MAG TPA: S-methyl-5-thioribose-1-phosphate isomerase [Thermoleophilaceae bacterium]|nr:S-methyl-5-thioribose-1-phosphate isomerase [Thermoleophilaceae bacterium]
MTVEPQRTATTEPLRFAGDALLILDQRALPDEERWIRCESAEEVAECIRTLAVRGAPAIGIAAAYGMALAAGGKSTAAAARLAGGPDPAAAAAPSRRDPAALASAADLLRSARPTAVNLAWAVDQVLASADPLECARRIHREQEAADRRLAALGAERFRPGDRALTHCNAGALATAGYGTAGGVLRAAWEQGRLEQVWVDETRPLNQGARLTTWELARDGIPHRLVTDSSAGALMARGLVDRIVVGADRIAANGDVANKVGTYPLAVLAARHGVPFYVAAPVSTIDPDTPNGDAIPIEERDPSELGAGVPAVNFAFDVTPAELVTAIVTEAGVLEPPYEDAIARVAAR